MTKEAALYNFWNSFSWRAYEENTVFDENGKSPAFPYITYEVQTTDFGNELSLSASLWDSSLEWSRINAKKREISDAIGAGGKIIPCDGGYIWIKRGNNFAQNMGDDSNDSIRRIVLNISVEFWTEN